MGKVLVSIPDEDLRCIDKAAREAGETRSSFLRRAALDQARRTPARPLDDPAMRRAFRLFSRRAQARAPITTEQALRARDRGRR
jgi:hypothetical protein